MRAATSRRVAAGLLVLSILLSLSSGAFVFLQHRSGMPSRYDHSYWEALLPLIWTLLFAAIGALIISRQPRNRIGWVFFAIELGWAVALPSGEYARYALFGHGGAPFGRVAAWLDSNLFLLPLLFPATFLLMWFPDGELPSRRWRFLPWTTAGGVALGLLSGALLPTEGGSDYPVDYPWRATGVPSDAPRWSRHRRRARRLGWSSVDRARRTAVGDEADFRWRSHAIVPSPWWTSPDTPPARL